MYRYTSAVLLLGLVTAAPSKAQSYTFLKVVDDRTLRPDGGGGFWPANPSLEGNMVVFNQGALCAGCPSPDSIWAANLDTGDFVKLVDKSQPVPGSTAKWDYFDARPVLHGGVVVFSGYDTGGKPGLYAVSVNGGAVTRLVDSTTAVPGGTGNFDRIDRGAFSHDGTTAVFAGGGGATTGVYSIRLNGTALARAADVNSPVNSNQCDVFPVYLFSAPTIGNGVISVRGQTVFDSSNGFNGLYIGPVTKTVNPGCAAFPSVVNSLERLPGDTAATPQTRYSYGAIDGQSVYFRADNPNTSYGGIFSAAAAPKTAGNPITKLVDTTTLLPVFGAVPFVNSYNFAASQQNVVFHAAIPGKSGLFLTTGGAVSKLIASDDTLDGYRVTGVDAPVTTSMSGADVAFVWNRSDFQRQLSVARLVSSSISIAGIANAASYAADAIAPGEVVTVFGTGLGPASLQTAALDGNGRVSTVRSTARIFFDGIPAPLVYVGAANGGQISAIVPYNIEGRQTVVVQAEYQGRLSAPFPMKVAPAVPGIYTADSSGKGQGAIQNQDGSYNSAANPAARGTIVTIYGSGMGQTIPQGIDGQISGPNAPRPSLAVSVTIGSIPVAASDIVYQAMAPLAVTGLYQMNLRIPASVPSGNQAVVLTVGGVSSPAGVTVAVQ